MEKSERALIIIGGKEDRSNNKVILQEVTCVKIETRRV